MTVINATQTTDAAAYIQEHGWTQHEMEDEHGAVCLTGALKACSPQPGDWLLAREVFRHLDRAEDWNDDPNREQEQVVATLQDTPVTAGLLADTFGPQWEQIVTLVRRVAVMTEAEAREIEAPWGAAWDATRGATRGAARNAAWGATRGATWDATWDATRGATRGAAWGAAWDAVWEPACDAAWEAACDAARALAVRDLINEDTPWNQAAYDALTQPLLHACPDLEPVLRSQK